MDEQDPKPRRVAAVPSLAVGGVSLALGIDFVATLRGGVESRISLWHVTYALPWLATMPFGVSMIIFGVCILAYPRMPRWVAKVALCLLFVALGAILLNVILALTGLICALL